MTAPVRLLLCEDDDDDAVLIVTHLRRDGLDVTYERVETAEAAARALRGHPPDIIISDYRMPAFTAEDALRLLHETGLDIPFILVSGQIGDEHAAALMRDGAHDFISKDHLTGIAPAVRRELQDAQVRRRRREAENALRKSEQRFRLFAENAPDIIFRYRLLPSEELEYVSPAAALILGHRPDELCGDPGHVLSFVDPADRPALERSWHSAAPEPLVVRWHRPDGTTVWTEQRAVAVRDEHGRPAAVEGILRDITAQVAAQRERERLEHRLRQVERLDSLGKLGGGVAHDFNNLLMVILGHAELALESAPDDSAVRDDLERIQRAAERGASLTRQLLIFSRLEPSRPEILDLNAVVEDTGQLLRRTIGEDVELIAELEPGLNTVRMDRSKLEQILLNVLLNARAAMPEGGRVTIRTAGVEAAGVPPIVRLSLTDTGFGMSPEVAERAFEPFFTTKRRGQGTGLGLSTVYGAVKEAGGEIGIESEPGEGTTVTIDLPATREPAPAAVDSGPARPHRRDATALVVEDDGEVRDLVETMLAQSGYQVIDTASPIEALRIADAGEPWIDVLLADVVMPGMSGVELAERIRRARPAVPVLLMSGHTTGSLPSGVVLPPRTALIRKPFTSADLLAQLDAILGPGG
ncbi:response regulator [Actinomadura rudentiformis]|uniref:histidine kinase n=2 Tax=Actinomadura rudentiformis TaxID=359158 RepID=A0A6H9YNN1_9ACTN|nr:response regulator [Actinomadura rudentiformis]